MSTKEEKGKDKKKKKLKLKILKNRIVRISLIVVSFILIISLGGNAIASVVSGAIAAILAPKEKEGDIAESYYQGKIPMSEEVLKYEDMMKKYIDQAVNQYNTLADPPYSDSSYKLKLSSSDVGIVEYMLSICAAVTNNGENMNGNIMGVRQCRPDCDQEESIREAAKLIVYLYAEMCLDPYHESHEIDHFKSMTTSDGGFTNYSFFADQFAFGGDYYRAQTADEGSQAEIGEKYMAEQKINIFTAMYLFGDSGIRQYYMIRHYDDNQGDYYVGNTHIKYYYNGLVLEYFRFLENEALYEAEQNMTDRGIFDRRMDVEEELEASINIYTPDFNLMQSIFTYYDYYNGTINRGGSLTLPIGSEYAYLISTKYIDPDSDWGHRTPERTSNGWSSEWHHGIDIPTLGKSIDAYAVLDGTITENYYNDSCGNYVTIRSRDGRYDFTYMHLEESLVEMNQSVKAGQLIAKTGNTGSSTGYHLHIEIYDHVLNGYIDPLFILTNGQERSVRSEDDEKYGAQNGFIYQEVLPSIGKKEVNGEDLRYIAAMIQCEAGNQVYAGKLAVGIVMVNRWEAGTYGETIYDVLTAENQFSPYASGSWATRIREYDNGTLNPDAISAAVEVLQGKKSVDYDGTTYNLSTYYFYCNPYAFDDFNWNAEYIWIDDQVFLEKYWWRY